MKAFLFYLLPLLATCVPTLFVAAADTCDECIAKACTYCRTGENTGQCVCDFDELAANTAFGSNTATCADVVGGTFATPTVTTKAGCEYFEEESSTTTCESCTSQPNCVYCEAAVSFGDTQSGCLCDGSIACDEVAYGSSVYFSESDCTFVEDFIKAFNQSASIATGLLVALIVVPILVILACIGVCIFCMRKKNTSTRHTPAATRTAVVTTVHKTADGKEEDQQEQPSNIETPA